MNKLQRIEEMEKQLAALRAEVEQEAKPKQWEPKGGSFIYHSAGVAPFHAPSHLKTGGCDFGILRQTIEQAEADRKLARAYNRLLAYKAEFDADFVPNWGNYCWDKFYIYYLGNAWGVTSAKDICILGVVYFSEQAARDLASKLNSGEVVL